MRSRAQDAPELGSVSVPSPPYSTRRTLSREGTLRVLVQLHFNEAADPDKRLASTEYCIALAPPGSKALGAAVAEAPQLDQVSPAEADADVLGAAAAGRPRRNGWKAGKPLAVLPRGSGSPDLDPAQRTVVRFVTQELKYLLPDLLDLNVLREETALAGTPSAKRPRI